MPNIPLITATVKVTAKDINGNNVAKQFNQVKELAFDFAKGMVNVIDATGSFYFPLAPITTLTYTVVSGVNGVTTIVMS